jgi:hypothetical protein
LTKIDSGDRLLGKMLLSENLLLKASVVNKQGSV